MPAKRSLPKRNLFLRGEERICPHAPHPPPLPQEQTSSSKINPTEKVCTSKMYPFTINGYMKMYPFTLMYCGSSVFQCMCKLHGMSMLVSTGKFCEALYNQSNFISFGEHLVLVRSFFCFSLVFSAFLCFSLVTIWVVNAPDGANGPTRLWAVHSCNILLI